MNEKAKFSEKISIDKQMGMHENVNWKPRWTIEKYHTPNGESIEGMNPYAVEKFDGNLLMNAGGNLLLDLLIGAGGTVFNNANAYIGVGDSNTAESASHTDLQAATNKLRKAMEATFPSVSAQTVTFKSVFGTTDANFAWEEFGVFNASTAGTMLNRKISSKGTKTGSDTWTVTIDITVA